MKTTIRRKRKKTIIRKEMIAGGLVLSAIIFGSKTGLLSDGPVEHTIPEGAISGGVYNQNGTSYERFQMDGYFYILDLNTGAIIPQ